MLNDCHSLSHMTSSAAGDASGEVNDHPCAKMLGRERRAVDKIP